MKLVIQKLKQDVFKRGLLEFYSLFIKQCLSLVKFTSGLKAQLV